jgi:diaminohydroxyphosphoribosylaminopyrimidine deaminase/5-amino-6-(5-phosphoribosylamino)uracil reductase
MKLRQGSDAIVAGINTILADDPSLSFRPGNRRSAVRPPLRRIILDSRARTPLTARVVTDEAAPFTTIVVSGQAPARRIAALEKRVRVLVAPTVKRPASGLQPPSLDLRWVLQQLGADGVSSLLVEGGGEVNASFLLGGLAQRVAFFYAPKILGGRSARTGVAGEGARNLQEVHPLTELRWQKLGADLLLTARVG